MNLSTRQKSFILILLVLMADQTLKIWVKTNMVLGEEIPVLGNWFIIHFTENVGMAFGIELGGELGKTILSLFRIAAVIAIGWYILHLMKVKAPCGLVMFLSLILAGAMGNIIDSAFYGMIFNESYHQQATFLPEEGGYAPFLHGRVVDMLYFPIIRGNYPEWLPFLGGERFIFFRPVFNIADAAITTGVAGVLIFYKGFFHKH